MKAALIIKMCATEFYYLMVHFMNLMFSKIMVLYIAC